MYRDVAGTGRSVAVGETHMLYRQPEDIFGVSNTQLNLTILHKPWLLSGLWKDLIKLNQKQPAFLKTGNFW